MEFANLSGSHELCCADVGDVRAVEVQTAELRQGDEAIDGGIGDKRVI